MRNLQKPDVTQEDPVVLEQKGGGGGGGGVPVGDGAYVWWQNSTQAQPLAGLGEGEAGGGVLRWNGPMIHSGSPTCSTQTNGVFTRGIAARTAYPNPWFASSSKISRV